MINCSSLGNKPYTDFLFFVAEICVAIIPWENFVYIIDYRSRVTFGLPWENRFSINEIWKLLSVAFYIYNSYLNSSLINEVVPISLVRSYDSSDNNRQQTEKLDNKYRKIN